MAERVEHWFNRRYHSGRRDEARTMLQRMLDTTPGPFATWAQDDPCPRGNTERINADGSRIQLD